MKKLLVSSFLIAGLTGILLGQPTYNITTVGGSTNNTLGDGGPPGAATLIQPVGVTADAAGNIYISDLGGSTGGGNNPAGGRIRKIDAKTGLISTLTSATSNPRGLGIDPAGKFLYVSSETTRVYKVDTTTGATTTYAGTGSGDATGDGHAATTERIRAARCAWVAANGDLYFCDTPNNRIHKVDATTGLMTLVAGRGPLNTTVTTTGTFTTLTLGDGAPAIQASLQNPEGLVGDNKGNLFIADTNANRIRKVALGSGMITTVAGLGTSGTADNVDALSAQFNAPRGLAFDSTGNFLYIADSGNNRVRKWNLASCATTDANGFPITASSGCNLVTTVAGGGSPRTGVGDGGAGLSATLNFPSSVWFDAAGNLYIADQNNGRIRILDPTGQINTVAGASQSRGDGGPATFATFNNPRGLAADSAGNVYVSDTNNQKIRKISSAGIVSTYAGTGNSGNTNFQARSDETTLPVSVAANTGSLNFPGCVAVDQTGTLYIADRVNSKIRKIDAYGNVSNAVSSNSITVSRTGVIGGNTPASGYAGDGGPAVLDKIGALSGAAGQQHLVNPTVSPRPDIVAAGANLGGDGFLSAGTSTNTAGPNCVAADSSGNIYIADTGNNVIRKVDSSGILTTVVGFPIAIPDKNGVNANIGVAGSEGDGGLAVNAQINAPQGVGVNPGGTFLCVADTGNHAVRMVNLIRLPPYSATNKCAANDFGCSGLASFPQGLPAGSINLVGGIIPDGGSDALPANGWQSRLNGPQGCAVDDALNIYVADTLNNRITVIDASGKMTLIAGGGSAFVSDGKAATTALLAFPVGIATDNKGVVYFTDRMGLIKQLMPVAATPAK